MPRIVEALNAADAVRSIRVVARVAVRREVPRHEIRCDADDPLFAEPLRGAVVSRAEPARRRELRLRVGVAAVLRHGCAVVLDHRRERAADRSNHVGPIDHHHVPTAVRCVNEELA